MTDTLDPSVQPVIDTERLRLRPLRRADIGLLEMFASDPRVAENTSSIPHPYPPGAAEAFVARATSGDPVEQVWAIDGQQAGLGELVGSISLKFMENTRTRQSEVGYWIAPAFWNTGLASEALDALLAANPQEVETIFAAVFQDNTRSARVLTNAGFAYLGDAEVYSVARNSTVPTWTYLKRLA